MMSAPRVAKLMWGQQPSAVQPCAAGQRLSGRLPYCTVNVTTSPCEAPPAATAVTLICDVPNAVGVATVTKVDPGKAASADVAVTVTVAGLGTTAGAVYRPVPSTVPFELPPVTAQVTLWSVEPFTVALNCC